jgi:hypothetical protein
MGVVLVVARCAVHIHVRASLFLKLTISRTAKRQPMSSRMNSSLYAPSDRIDQGCFRIRPSQVHEVGQRGGAVAVDVDEKVRRDVQEFTQFVRFLQLPVDGRG